MGGGGVVRFSRKFEVLNFFPFSDATDYEMGCDESQCTVCRCVALDGFVSMVNHTHSHTHSHTHTHTHTLSCIVAHICTIAVELVEYPPPPLPYNAIHTTDTMC